MIRRLLPLLAGAVVFGTGLRGGPIAADQLARFPFGGRPLGLLLHLAVIATVFEVWRRIRDSPDEGLWAALLFAVLPATSEAVLGAGGRGPQLATLVVLIGLLMHADGRGRLLSARLALAQWIGLQLHVSALALMPLILLHDALLVRRPIRDSLVRVGPGAAVAFVTLAVQATPGPLGQAWAAVPFIAEGLGRVLVPHTQTIAWLPEPPAPSFAGLLTIAALGVAVGVVILRRRSPRDPAAGLFGFGWWGLAMIPLLPTALAGKVVPESALYLGVVGPCLALGGHCVGFRRWFIQIGRGKLARGLLAAIVLLLGARSALRVQDWRDDFLLHLSAVEDEPNNAEALYRYGTYLAIQGERLSSAKSLARAYELQPERVDIANNFAVTLMRRGRWAVAETLLRRASARAPGDQTVKRNLARASAKDFRGATLRAP